MKKGRKKKGSFDSSFQHLKYRFKRRVIVKRLCGVWRSDRTSSEAGLANTLSIKQ